MTKLAILSQPGTAAAGIDFYKDEGGKGNWMRIVVACSAPLTREITLRTKLFFESGLPVEESDQKILLVRPGGSASADLSSKKLLIGPNRKKCAIEFRIQKVSRRKDNQRFKVQISAEGNTKLVPVFTRPITVLSKRKIPARLRNDPEAIARYKADKANKAKRSAAKQQESCAGNKRARSEDATPEMRPHSTVYAKDCTQSSNGSNKRQRLSVNTGIDAALRAKIEQMARTVDNLYAIMVDQRVQISRLQEQVRVLTDNQEPMFSDIGPSTHMPATGLDVLNSVPVSPIKHDLTRRGSNYRHQLFNEDATTGKLIPGSPSLRPKKTNSHLQKERNVNEVMADSEMMQWSFVSASIPELPELNL